jgi:hypothetical protein
LHKNRFHPVRLNLSTRLINHNTLFFSHNKTTSAGLLAAKTSAEQSFHSPIAFLYLVRTLESHSRLLFFASEKFGIKDNYI